MKNSSSKINWPNTLFLILTPIVAIGGTIWLAMTTGLHSNTLWLTLAFTIISGLAVTAGYHRLFSHRAYKAAWPVRLFFLLFGSAAFEGSVMEWCADHRRHHLYVDTDRDPYNINKGFWYAHMGWLFVSPANKDYSNVKDLAADPLVRLQHKFSVPIAATIGFLLPMAIASLWGDAWGGFILAGALRITFNQQLTFCVNSVCHYWGKRRYSSVQTARDNWITALFTYGEGFHNFHHQFMFDYRNGIRAYHFDPAKWLIRSLAYLGLAKDLKTVPQKQILRYRLRVEESSLAADLKHYSEDFCKYLTHLLKPLHERILHLSEHLEQLEQDYLELKRKKLEHMKEKASEYRARLQAQRMRLHEVQQELKKTLMVWTEVRKPIAN